MSIRRVPGLLWSPSSMAVSPFRKRTDATSIRSFRPLFSLKSSTKSFSIASRPFADTAFEVDKVAVRSPHRGDRLRIAVVERLDEGFSGLGDLGLAWIRVHLRPEAEPVSAHIANNAQNSDRSTAEVLRNVVFRTCPLL